MENIQTVSLINIVDYPQIHFTNACSDEIIDRGLSSGSLPVGQYGFAVARENFLYIVRDPTGCNKLFFGRGGDGILVVANRAVRVWRQGVPLSAIGSCPPGHVLQVSHKGVHDLGGSDISGLPSDTQIDFANFTDQTRSMLDQAFRWLASKFEGCRFVVCLSGGLDSSVVASFAVKHLPNVTAVSFTYLNKDDLRSHALGAPVEELASASDDFRCAAKVASKLGLQLLPTVRSKDAVAGAIRASVQLCQDWRDFNVHCATVNLFLAQDVRAAFPGEKVVILTGDLMNEYVCDYVEEQVDGAVYYKIPRIPLDKRRKYVVRGLDAGDREIGVFWAYGLIACQPYAVLGGQYMRLPRSVLERPNIKWVLNGPLLMPQLERHVNRSKTRAQVGGKDLGTLGIYHRLGVGEEQLRLAWEDQFPTESSELCREFIQFGRYKASRYVEQV
jgi:hypothetical protein